MPNALTKFGQRCRDLRTKYRRTIGEQSDEFGCQPHEISSIETGQKALPSLYVKKFVDWLQLTDQEAWDLQRRIESNVVAFPHSKGGDKSRSMRMFRKISKMNPEEIRGIRKHPPP